MYKRQPGGGSFHLFGGPHPIELPLQLDPGIPTTLVVGGFAQHELVAVPGTATMRLATRLTRLSLQVAYTGAVIGRDLAAGARGDVPVALTPPPDDAVPGLAPEVRATLVGVRSDLATAVADLAFDTASHARIANAQVSGVGPFGTARTDALEERLRSEFEAWVRGQGPQWSPLGAAALRVVEGVDSAAVTTLASWPTAQWVDADTFGVFGHHVAAAVGGAPGQKAGGDLASPGDERLDVTTRLLGRVPVPAHRFSIEVSAGSVLRFIVLDELNKYAPRQGTSPIKEVLVDIAARGRSLGVILIGAGYPVLRSNGNHNRARVWVAAVVLALVVVVTLVGILMLYGGSFPPPSLVINVLPG